MQLVQQRALGERHEQLDVGQRALELGQDPLAQLLQPLAGGGADEHGLRVAEAELAAALVVEQVGLVEHEHPRRGDLDLLEHVLDGLVIASSSSSGAQASTTCRTWSASLVSSSVAANASTS